jgi:alkylation response protein AidB-like acyl-CoA dehydrogenase
MDFELTADQEALRDAAGDLLASRSSPEVVRRAVDAAGRPDEALWSAMVDQGWCGIAVAEDAGGIGLGWVEAAVLLEQVGAFVAPAPILGQLVALDLLAATEWGPGLIDGSTVAAVTDGLDQVVAFAPIADVVVVADADRVRAIDLAGCRPDPEPAMDVTRTLGWLRADAVAAAPTTELGGTAEAERLRDVAAVAYSAEVLGISQRLLDLTVEYAKDRMQFGRAIGSFQAVKHRCADMLVDVEGMRSSVYWAAWCVAERHEDASVAASTAKAWCSEAVTRVTSSALQVHGGIGFTWEHDAHLYLKRAHLDAMSFGTAADHRTRLARMLRGKVEAGEPVL